jgi:hypothetical protein
MTARASLLVFDDYVASGTFGGVYVYTPDVFNDALGLYDSIACEATVDKVTVSGSGSFKLYFQHSADNRNFVFTNGLTTPPAAPEIVLASLSTTAVNFAIAAYQGTYPLLGMVRFALQFGESTTAAHIKLFVLQRDLA